MQPFTFDQAIIAGLLFLLGLLIGMFLLASPKWKRRYKAEHARVQELEREVDHLGRENREFHSLRERAERHPARGPLAAEAGVDRHPATAHRVTSTAPVDTHRPGDIGTEWKPYRDSDGDGTPDAIDRRS